MKKDREIFLSEDFDYVQDCRAFLAKEKMSLANGLLWTMFAFFALALLWASRAELDEVTRGSGKVIPSSSVQIIESLEGGILEAISVKEGDIVEPGDILLKIDDTIYAASYRENSTRRDVLTARLARLRAESL
ncbi:MAG: biotin/lipoyl-binding protein, partial [Verrucomicrobiales bacterium]